MLTIGALAITACSPEFPPAAVAVSESVPTVLWKFCDDDEGVAAMVVSRVTDEDPESWPMVWTAELREKATALDQVPIANDVSGYVIETGRDWPLRPHVRYAVTEAVNQEGVNVLGNMPEFRPADLTERHVIAGEDEDQDVSTWLGADGPRCQ